MNILPGPSMRSRAIAALAVAFLFGAAASASAATAIERVVSPSGIEAWLVREPATPLVAIDFAFRGGADEDPGDKPGVAHMVADLLDEGAGTLEGNAFHEQLERHAIEMSFGAGRDFFRGSLRTLAEHRDTAVDLLRLAVNEPRFDDEAIERARIQILTTIRRASTSPQEIASLRWWGAAFPGHPYGRQLRGTLDSVPQISADDLKAYTKRVFARANLKIGVVGDIDAATLGRMLDEIFGALPQTAELRSIPEAAPQGLGRFIRVNLNVPQTVIQFGGPGLLRRDPDFIAGALVNHVLSGGSLSSRLYREVREKRGLAYSVSTGLYPFDHAGVFSGATATRFDRAEETLEVVSREIARLATDGPTEEELAKAKSYLKGAYALNFDSSSKIAGQLVQLQLDDLGIDYVERRKDLIDAVTLDDARRVAKRVLQGPLLFAIVGRPADAVAGGPGAAGAVKVPGGLTPAVGVDAAGGRGPVSLH
jgi:zinc protease